MDINFELSTLSPVLETIQEEMSAEDVIDILSATDISENEQFTAGNIVATLEQILAQYGDMRLVCTNEEEAMEDFPELGLIKNYEALKCFASVVVFTILNIEGRQPLVIVENQNFFWVFEKIIKNPTYLPFAFFGVVGEA